MDLEFRHLRMLLAIAEAGSLGRAAAATGFSQPSVSGQLKRLENYFGGTLFDRSAAGVRPTPLGVQVIGQAREVLARVDALGRDTAGAAPDPTSPLRLAATNTPILAGMIGHARTALPQLAPLVSSVYATVEIVELIERGEADAGLAVDYPGMELHHSPALAHRGIVTEPAFVALSREHPASRQQEVDLADLADSPWFLTPDDGAGWPGVFYSACRARGFAPAAVHEFLGDQHQLQTMIAAGVGVSVVQATIRPIAGVSVKPLTGTPLWTRYVLVWSPERVPAATADTLFGAAARAYQELIAHAPHFQTWASGKYRLPRC
ncbi:LysR family transcriptional regulator [Kitasatospora sp. NPDC058965]|uniref:LysR family transcriptional regulator n=1 Tax=Kitasatospora sp. NPDC058965 TaxID=3346682 RepID=UPI00367943D1